MEAGKWRHLQWTAAAVAKFYLEIELVRMKELQNGAAFERASRPLILAIKAIPLAVWP